MRFHATPVPDTHKKHSPGVDGIVGLRIETGLSCVPCVLCGVLCVGGLGCDFLCVTFCVCVGVTFCVWVGGWVCVCECVWVDVGG